MIKNALKNLYVKISLSLILVYTIVGFLLFPFLLKTYLGDITQKYLNAYSSTQSIYFNPYTLEMSMEDFIIHDKNDKTLAQFALLDVNFNTNGIFKSKLLFKNIYLKNLNINVDVSKENIFNFDNITSHLNKQDTNETQETNSSVTLFVENFHLDDSIFTFRDDRQEESFEVKSRPFDFIVKDFSTAEQEEGNFEFMIATYKTGKIKSSAKIRTKPFKVEGDFNIIDFNTNKLYGYFKKSLDFKVAGDNINASLNYAVSYEDSLLDISLSKVALNLAKMDLVQGENGLSFTKLDAGIDKLNMTIDSNSSKVNVNGINLVIDESTVNNNVSKLQVLASKLHIKDVNINENSAITMNLEALQFLDTSLQNKNTKLVNIKELALVNVEADISKNEFDVESFTIDTADIRTALYKDMTTDFDKLVKKKAQSKELIQKPLEEESKQVSLNLKKFEIKNSSFVLVDKKKKTTLKLKKINTMVEDAQFAESSSIPFNFSYLMPNSGGMNGDGEIKLNPFVAKVNLNINKMNLKPYNPYIKDFANLDLNSGYFTSKAYINVRGEKINFKGSSRLLKIDLKNSITKETLLKAKSLSFNKIKATNKSLKMDSIVIDNTYMNFAIDQNGTTNIKDVLIKTEEEVQIKEDENATNDFKFLISKIKFKDSSMDFLDKNLPIDFKAHINELNGDILTISSNPKEALAINLDGVVNKYGEAHIKGDVITIDPKKSLNILVDFKNIDITKMSGYSGKFIGQEISKGKLWIALNYEIKDSQLLSTNNIRLKDLELGENVDSEEATALPVGLAIALLKDNDGYIDIDMPVEGDVDNPDFKYGGAVWSAVGNLLTGIVSSPFNFLASSLGIDDDELSIINFEYGSKELLPVQKEKLDTLHTLLQKRPELVLSVGRVVIEDKDVLALKKKAFDRKILEKFKNNDDIEDKYDFVADVYEEKLGVEKQKMLLNQLVIEKYVDEAFDKERFNRESQALIQIQTLDIDSLTTLALQRQQSTVTHIKSLGLNSNQLVLADKLIKLTESNESGVNLVLGLDVKK